MPEDSMACWKFQLLVRKTIKVSKSWSNPYWAVIGLELSPLYLTACDKHWAWISVRLGPLLGQTHGSTFHQYRWLCHPNLKVVLSKLALLLPRSSVVWPVSMSMHVGVDTDLWLRYHPESNSSSVRTLFAGLDSFFRPFWGANTWWCSLVWVSSTILGYFNTL